ncbi:MAG: AMP-binding protein [Firmicutes bacterium]|nr:AMP-binding protein [Bacillota bacterium]MBQ3122628.1 AMP-binding protein [Bacillota bacterium]MBQ9971897.1 AMP-binding protein [Bacillota bacterium]
MNSKKYRNSFYEVRQISSIRDMFLGSTEMFADRTAYLVKERPGGKYVPVSYAKVRKDVDSFGTGLVNLGLKGKKIAIVGENSYEWVMTYFAVVNGVGVVVPLDKELPPGEMKNLIERAHLGAIVYSKKCEKLVLEAISGLPEGERIEHLICMKDEHHEDSKSLSDILEAGRKSLENGDRRYIDSEIDDEALCTLMFTSGTTGMSKGVMLSHRNLAANVYNMSKYVHIREGGVGLSVLPMHHAYEMTCHIFTAFYQGVTVAVCEGLKYIMKNMNEAGATVMLGVPLIFENAHKKIMKNAEAKGKYDTMRQMIELSKKYKLYNKPKVVKKIFKDVHAAFGGKMELLIVGGAPINPKIIEDFQAMGIPMIQGYGMSENSPIIAVNRDRYSKPSAAGFPMPGTEVKIVDMAPDGVGEIVVRGPSVMIGYFENEEATKEAIRGDWLYTGDYGYFDNDGFLYISGRKKNVIVTKNGKNIFPEEIEHQLNESVYISESLVHGIIDEKSGDTVVKAEIYPDYAQIKEDVGELEDIELERFIKKIVEEVNDSMPGYKRVMRIGIRRTEFIKNSSRKIRRNEEGNYREN